MSSAKHGSADGEHHRTGSGVRRTPGEKGHEPAAVAAGLSLTFAFVLSVGLAVAVAAIAASLLNYALATAASNDALDEAGTSAALNAAAEDAVVWTPVGSPSTMRKVTIQPARFTRRGEIVPGLVYRALRIEPDGRTSDVDIKIDSSSGEFRRQLLLSLFGSSLAVVAVGVLVAFLLSRRIVSPLEGLIEDVRILSHGNLDHRVRVQAGGELGLLAKSVDRMIRGLRDAQAAAREREQHEHDLAIAAEIRSSLLPEKTPDLPGFEISAHLAAADSVGGDLYDYVEDAGGASDGAPALGLLVAGISARGVPGAMLMTMARAYLHQAFEREAAPAAALRIANRPITRDMRRGLFVTALAAVTEGSTGRVRAASAGHKAPLLHWVAAKQELKKLHLEGIALGFDPGPVFDRTVRETELMLAPGDRLILASAGVFAVRNAEGQELGEEGFYALVGKHAAKTSAAFCQLLGSEFDRYRGDEPLPEDAVIVTVRRKKGA